MDCRVVSAGATWVTIVNAFSGEPNFCALMKTNTRTRARGRLMYVLHEVLTLSSLVKQRWRLFLIGVSCVDQLNARSIGVSALFSLANNSLL